MEKKTMSDKLNLANSSKILSSSRFEKQYLMSALSTRIFIVGLGETKSLNAAIRYFKGLDKKYNGFTSPFYFDKVLKHNGKFFWNPFLPTFFSEAFERYIINEFENLKEDQGLMLPGVSYIDFTSCGSQSRLNTTIDLFVTKKFKLYDLTHKLYIKWNQPRSMNYMLARFLNVLDLQTEPWLVIDDNAYEYDYESLSAKGIKGVIINLGNEYSEQFATKNIGYNNNPIATLIRNIRNAGLIAGINLGIRYAMEDNLQLVLKNSKDLGTHFMIWQYDCDDLDAEQDQRKINQAAIERAFLKAGSSKEYEQFPLIFYPEFFEKINKNKSSIRKYAAYSFENGNMIQHSGPYTSLFREILTIRKAKPYNTQYSGIYAPATKR